MTERIKTAAALMIGSEILSGKIQDTNTYDLAQMLRAAGVELRRVVVVGDDIATIVESLNALRLSHDYVFTSGGVGPTHDDVTIEALAVAFGRRVVTSETLAKILIKRYGADCSADHLRMALIVEGTEFFRGIDGRAEWPVQLLGNVVVLPGVPQIFRMKLELLLDRLRSRDHAFYLCSVYCKGDEAALKAQIDDVVKAFADVVVGSYPRWFDDDHSVRVTFDGLNFERVQLAAKSFAQSIRPDWLVRIA
jgi:molybdenum cofactor synthesis domain-containing protein